MHSILDESPAKQEVTELFPVCPSLPALGKFPDSYFLDALLSANFTAVSSASPALTLTSGLPKHRGILC
jgi:hypothetical protein